MLLMVEKHFQEAPFTWKQRASFWAAFLYYMSSAALLFTGPFPTLTMLWFFPRSVYPHNYLVMLPSIAATLFVFPMLSRAGGRPSTGSASSIPAVTCTRSGSRSVVASRNGYRLVRPAAKTWCPGW